MSPRPNVVIVVAEAVWVSRQSAAGNGYVNRVYEIVRPLKAALITCFLGRQREHK
jgi:hypothetical protein